MNKKLVKRKEVQPIIREERTKGKSDQKIYNQLAQQYGDKKALALLITGTATEENSAKYKGYNNILLVLLAATALFKSLTAIGLSSIVTQPWILAMIYLFPLLNIYFFYEIMRFNATSYRFLGLISVVGFLQSIQDGAFLLDVVISGVLAAPVVILAFYLDNKLFPNFKPTKLQKDKNGEYILS